MTTKRLSAIALLIGTATILLAGCGGDSTTTVVQSTTATGTDTTTTTATTTTEATTTVKQPADDTSASDAGDDSAAQGDPPDVVGLTLPTAEKQLKEAGFKPDVSNTDTTFGIIVKSNYTVCKQDDPVGNVVPILAQKYGC